MSVDSQTSSHSGCGLAVRWSLQEAPAEVAQQLRDYVVGTSLSRFTQLPGLRSKTWRMRQGEWFEGTYVFADAISRDVFLAQFTPGAADSPGSVMIGCAPELIEPFEVVAVAEGPAEFCSGPGRGPSSPWREPVATHLLFSKLSALVGTLGV